MSPAGVRLWCFINEQFWWVFGFIGIFLSEFRFDSSALIVPLGRESCWYECMSLKWTVLTEFTLVTFRRTSPWMVFSILTLAHNRNNSVMEAIQRKQYITRIERKQKHILGLSICFSRNCWKETTIEVLFMKCIWVETAHFSEDIAKLFIRYSRLDL